MIRRKTGEGELPRKLLTMLMASAMMSLGSVALADNKVIIEQVGSSNTVSITQVVSNNRVGNTGLGQESTITGSNNSLTTSQTGNQMKAEYNGWTKFFQKYNIQQVPRQDIA